MIFSMTVMHAVINQRERFNSFGWTQPYYFSPNDLAISIRMLADICNPLQFHEPFPDRLMQYLVSTLNYGGKITDDEDQRVLNQIASTFINSSVHRGGLDVDYRFAASLYDLVGPEQEPLLTDSMDDQFAEYFVSPQGKERSYRMPDSVDNLHHMKSYISDTFPLVDMPQIFGLHETATIKQTTDLAADIFHRAYIYQFVVKKPKRVVLN